MSLKAVHKQQAKKLAWEQPETDRAINIASTITQLHVVQY
jgi:hypothetical protein